FFVTTDFIGSSQVPWWDAEEGIASHWMDWQDVRQLAADGFEIGSHTVHHADLGKVRGDEAYREITDSKSRLESELQREVTLFAYPYGGRPHLDEANRALVRKAGYACCVSAFGGSVRSGTDPFRIRRTPVSPWYLSPYQFGFETVLAHVRDGHAAG
ncbi:MAG: polysaccharide deacetylase family protein, partial [Gemmatimonadales bacterium]|nr:polysaccharide deacetylase family protein [Gemmatimonadales bacterium]